MKVRTPPGPRKILEHLFLRRPLGQAPDAGEFRALMLALLATPAPGRPGENRFLRETSLLGWRLVKLLRLDGVRVHLAAAAEYNRHTDHAPQVGRYQPRRRALWFDASRLAAAPGAPFLRAYGHALDHLIGRSTAGYAPSLTLWQGFQGQRTDFVSERAEEYPREYLAESVEAWFLPGGQRWLQHHDPGMHAFLDAVFSLSHD